MKYQKERDGFSYVLGLIDTVSPYGKQRKRGLLPYKDQEMLQKELLKTRLLSERLPSVKETVSALLSVLAELKDIRGIVEVAEKKMVLSIVDLYEVKFFLRKISQAAVLWSGMDVKDINLVPLPHLEKLLDPEESGLGTFHLYDSYDEELPEIRRQKRALEKEVRSTRGLEERESLLLQRRALIQREEEVEHCVRKSLSEAVSQEAPALFRNMEILGEMDFLIAKARLAWEHSCPLPKIEMGEAIILENAWHPYFAHLLEKRGKKMTRISLKLSPGSTALTGANMGGKSIALKTIYLNTALTLRGILPFAEAMSCPMLDEVYLLYEDQEEAHSGLSSFGGEVVRIREILGALATEPSLLLLDEPARGTNPTEGTAIVGGLLRYFKDKQHFLLAATHYDLHHIEGIDRYQVRGLKNIPLEGNRKGRRESSTILVDSLQELMDYTLEKWDGLPSSGEAVRIAEYLGIQEELTTEIRKLLK